MAARISEIRQEIENCRNRIANLNVELAQLVSKNKEKLGGWRHAEDRS